MKAVLQDTYQTIDQDDEESFFSNNDDDDDSIIHKTHRNTNEPIIRSKMNNLESCVNKRSIATLNSSERKSNDRCDAVNKSTDRLIEAIEALRYSIQGNTELHSRTHQRHRPHNRRRISTYTGNRPQQSRDTPGNIGDESLKIRKDKVAVELRIVFLKIGEIDTLKELYHADCFIQAKWREPKLDVFTVEQLAAVDLDKYWSPLLYIDNILSETKEAQWLTTSVNELGEVSVIERRRIKGVFLETLELNDFPLDVQDLTITMTSERPDCEVDLIPDQAEMSAINIQTFVDQQEWKLHEHVEITKRIVLQEYSSTMKSHPCLSVTCRAARRPGYFYWNVFLIMFMISGLSFATFSVSPEKAEYRLRLSFTLVLTSVTFKYVITQSLPKISYLTYMDKYVLMSLAILCIVSIWHACVTLVPQRSNLSLLNMHKSPATSAPSDHFLSRSTNINESANAGVTSTLLMLDRSTVNPINNKSTQDSPPKLLNSQFLRSLLRSISIKQPEQTNNNANVDPTEAQKSAYKQLKNIDFIDDDDDEDGGGGSNQSENDNSQSDSDDDNDVDDEDGKKRLTLHQIEFLKRIERDVLISFGALYILAHLVFIFWLYFDASKRRRIMRQKDKDYREFLQRNRQWQQKRKSPPSPLATTSELVAMTNSDYVVGVIPKQKQQHQQEAVAVSSLVQHNTPPSTTHSNVPLLSNITTEYQQNSPALLLGAIPGPPTAIYPGVTSYSSADTVSSRSFIREKSRQVKCSSKVFNDETTTFTMHFK